MGLLNITLLPIAKIKAFESITIGISEYSIIKFLKSAPSYALSAIASIGYLLPPKEASFGITISSFLNMAGSNISKSVKLVKPLAIINPLMSLPDLA